MPTTREKILGLVDELERTRPQDVSEQVRQLVEVALIAKGFGFDVWKHLVPESDADADLLVDQMLALLFHLRGDDLPPFDLERVALDHDEPGDDA